MHVGYSMDGETTTRALYTYWNDGMAFATLSEDKEEPKWTSKKDLMCFRCKKVSHYSIKCEEEVPAKTTKKGSNMLIKDEDSSQYV